jgi:hypothetical protein
MDDWRDITALAPGGFKKISDNKKVHEPESEKRSPRPFVV